MNNTLKQLQEKGEEEFDKKFIYDDDEDSSTPFTFVNQSNIIQDPTDIKDFLHQQTTLAFEAGKAETIAQERLRAFEILHKYAMETKDVQFLDLIEKAQKDLLAKE